MIPLSVLSSLNVSDLNLLIEGLPEINVEEIRKYAQYSKGFNYDSDVVNWVFEILEEFDQTQRAFFWHFISGSMKVPIGGYKTNPVKFIKLSYHDDEWLPTTHACFFHLEIPAYSTKVKTREKLLMAIFESGDEFLIA